MTTIESRTKFSSNSYQVDADAPVTLYAIVGFAPTLHLVERGPRVERLLIEDIDSTYVVRLAWLGLLWRVHS